MRIYRAWAIFLISLEFLWTLLWMIIMLYFIFNHTVADLSNLPFTAIIPLRLIQGAVLSIIEHHRSGNHKMDLWYKLGWTMALSLPVMIDVVSVCYTSQLLTSSLSALYTVTVIVAAIGLGLSISALLWFLISANVEACGREIGGGKEEKSMPLIPRKIQWGTR